MPPIKHTQLFDFPAYQTAIKEAKTSSEEFGKSLESVIGRLQQEQKQLNASLKEYASILKSFSSVQANAGQALKQYNKEIDANISGISELKLLQKGLAQVVDVSKSSISQLEAEMKGLTAQYKALRPGQADYAVQVENINKRMKEIVPTVQAMNQALKNSKASVDAAEGSYKAMQQQLTQLRNQLRNLPGAFDPVTGRLNKTNKEAVGLNKEIQRLDGVLKNADKTMGIYVRNVGNYQSAFKGFGASILTAVGAIIGIQSAFQGLQFIFNVNKDFDSLNAAIKLVSGSTAEFAINQSFLRKTADDLGLEIVGLTKNFKNFYAASVTAGLSGEQTRKIFEQVSRVGANLKLSQDDLNGVFTAFGQIISKGKVQAEELRGQIGERLPGAFAVAAKAIGVTQAQLNKMLQDGKVISTDFLPKFAAELEKTFGGGSERVEGLQAAVNRFSNALKDIANDDSGGLNQFFTKLINFFTGALKGAEKFFQFVFDKLDPAAAKTRDLGVAFGDAYNENISKSIEEITKALKSNGQELDKQIKRYKDLKAGGEAADVLSRQLAIVEQQTQRVKGIIAAFDAKSNGTSVAPTDLGTNPNAEKEAEKAQKAFEARIRKKQEYYLKLAELEQQENELAFVRGEKSENKFQERKLEIVAEYAGKATDLELQLGKNADEARITDFKKRLVDAQVSYESFLDKSAPKPATTQTRVDIGGKSSNIDTSKALDAPFVKAFEAEIAAREAKAKREEEIEKEKQERIKQINQEAADTIGQALLAVNEAIAASNDAKFERRIAQIEQERDREIAAAGNNAAARERIDANYNRKVAREKQKQARAQKQAALIEVGINTAVGIAKTFAELGWPAGIIGAAFVAAQGVIQAALIASKPIPQFRKGTKNAPKGPALINEEGFELIEKNGRMRVVGGRNRIVNLEGGEKIHTHAESKRMLANAFKHLEDRKAIGDSGAHGRIAASLSQLRQEENAIAMAKAIGSQMTPDQLAGAISRGMQDRPIHQTIYDERGITKRTIEKNQIITYLGKQHSI